jgi:hypothetical protein
MYGIWYFYDVPDKAEFIARCCAPYHGTFGNRVARSHDSESALECLIWFYLGPELQRTDAVVLYPERVAAGGQVDIMMPVIGRDGVAVDYPIHVSSCV